MSMELSIAYSQNVLNMPYFWEKKGFMSVLNVEMNCSEFISREKS